MSDTEEAWRFRPGLWEDLGVERDLEAMWRAFSQAYHELAPPGLPRGNETQVRRELLFCLLGGHGISFELSCSALQALDEIDIFTDDQQHDELHEQLVGVLAARRFEPLRKDGTYRRYRFPRRKADLICGARNWLLAAGSLTAHLAARTSDHERRTWLLGCPGLGPKSASWVLRNTGWAQDLAILDVHVLRAMTDAGVLPVENPSERYEQTERRFLDWCETLGVAPAVFDLFLWEWQRGTLRPVDVALAP